MVSIASLATEVGRRYHETGISPRLLVDAVLDKYSVNSPDVRHSVLSECGRRGGMAPRRNKQATTCEILQAWRDREKEHRRKEDWERVTSANEHVCPVD